MSQSLAAQYRGMLFDLDGTLYEGNRAVPHAATSLNNVKEHHQTDFLYITNNAGRPPEAVASQLNALGFTAAPQDVATSAQAAAALLRQRLKPGEKVLVVGTSFLAEQVATAGLTPVYSFDDSPTAVVQGLDKEMTWSRIAEAALAVNAGAWWLATNLDPTLPLERGKVPGNGSLVAAVAHATGKQPAVAGKPGASIFLQALKRAEIGAHEALMVGDRLDTDIEGAHSAGIDSLLVLTGVSQLADVIRAPDCQQPTFIANDLTALRVTSADQLRPGMRAGWAVEVTDNTLTLCDIDRTGRELDARYAVVDAARRIPEDRRLDITLLGHGKRAQELIDTTFMG